MTEKRYGELMQRIIKAFRLGIYTPSEYREKIEQLDNKFFGEQEKQRVRPSLPIHISDDAYVPICVRRCETNYLYEENTRMWDMEDELNVDPSPFHRDVMEELKIRERMEHEGNKLLFEACPGKAV
jgi:hypothetical protein